MAYLDTSVLGSYYCPEVFSAEIDRLLSALDEAAISPLVEVEFCSLVALKVRRKELARVAGQQAIALFRQHLSSEYYTIYEISAREYDTARTWLSSFNTNLRTADALHLACAFNHGQPIWTTDKPLAQAAKELAVKFTLITA